MIKRTAGEDFGQSIADLEEEVARGKGASRALQISQRFFEIASGHSKASLLLKELAHEIQKLSGCEAVGIRILDNGGNIPYQGYVGFTKSFYTKESPLSIHSDQCMCINVIKGETDPSQPFYTKAGSFFMNGTTRFLSAVSEEDKGQTRNVCNQVGYESVALIPIYFVDRIFGLIHLADPHENRVPREMVELFEKAAKQLGTAIQLVSKEEALREEKLLSEEYINSLPGLFYVFDEGRFVRWNEKWETITGYSSKEIGEMYGPDFFEGPDRALIADRMKAVFIEGTAEAEAELVTKLNRRIPYYFTGRRKRFSGKDYLIGLGIDITELRRLEERLKEENNIRTTLTESLPYPTMLIRKDRTVIFANQIARQLGAKVGGLCWRDFGNSDYISDEDKAYINQHKKIPPEGTRCTFCLADDCLVDSQLTKAPKIHAFGKVWEACWVPVSEEVYLHYALDVTDRKRAEEALEEAHNNLEKKVKERTRKYKKVNKRLGEEIKVRNNIENRLLDKTNELGERIKELNCLYGISSLVGRSDISIEEILQGIIELIPKAWQARDFTSARIVFKGKEYRTNNFQETNRKMTRDIISDVKWVGALEVYSLEDGSFLKEEQDLLNEIGERLEELIERKRLKDQLIRTERLAATGQLAASIAHEINSPLQGITSLIGLMEENHKQDKKLLEELSLLKGGYERIRNIVKSLLDLNRPGKELKQSMSINTVIKNTVKLIEGYLKKNKVGIQLNLASNIPDISASPQQLGQVALNLIMNAVEAMAGGPNLKENDLKNGGPTNRQIAVTTRLERDKVIVEVSDSGPGISKDAFEYIFDPFYTTKKKMGIGIGLSVCNGIIENHNGMISAKNSSDGHAVFTITLPAT